MLKSKSMGHRQKGVSAVGWIAIMAIFAFLVVTFFKVFPMYYDNFKVQSSLEALAADNSIDPKSRRAIWDSLQKRLYINEVRNITREDVTMTRKDGQTTIQVDYEVKDNYIFNLFIGARFSETIVIER